MRRNERQYITAMQNGRSTNPQQALVSWLDEYHSRPGVQNQEEASTETVAKARGAMLDTMLSVTALQRNRIVHDAW